MQAPRVEDLDFKPHPVLGQSAEAVAAFQRLRAVHPYIGRTNDNWPNIQSAIAEFSNGWSLSILRGLGAVHVHGSDWESCRFYRGHRRGDPTSWASPGELQAELDAVAALPPEDQP